MQAPPQLIPVIPETAPFTPEQRTWLNGFIAGVLARAPAPAAAVPAGPPPRPLAVVFGSQTGTAENLAKRAARIAGTRGFSARVLDMAHTSPPELAREANVLVITSTHGDGEPPDNARALHAALGLPGSLALAAVRFSVCGLGDTNYVRFCQAAKDFDERLEKLGARRVHPRAECDLEYEKPFGDWLDAALGCLGAAEAGGNPPTEPAATGHGRKNPFPAPLLASRAATLPGSAKQVQHVEFSLAGSGLNYEAGDALGVWPQNNPELVVDILAALGCDGEEEVTLRDGSNTSLRRALTHSCDLGRLTPELAARFAGGPPSDGEAGQPDLHLVDAIARFPEARPSPSELVALMRPLSPRLYSIASSPRAHPGQVHLTVAAVRYHAHGRRRHGVCSTFLADRVVPGESRIGVYVHPNPSFRLPDSDDASIIMIGPGTGIAPFRAFLHERRARGSRGKAWLFFGDQHARTDFLYAPEIEEFQRDGTLTRVDTAFSRDQPEKIYVQHRMLEQALELYVWLEAGAYLYVCGDASRMAKDVDDALHQVVAKAMAGSPTAAARYVNALRAAKRYRRDVY